MSYLANKLRLVEKAKMPKGFAVLAPISGSIHPITVIDQPLFNSGVLGEGLAIEMAGNKIVAPFDGIVTELPGTCHRIQLKAKNGIKLMILLAVEAELLMGAGFTRLVSEQQTVTKGQPLLNFNLQQLQRLSHPCYCGLFITNAEQIGNLYCSSQKVTAGEDVLLTITARKKS